MTVSSPTSMDAHGAPGPPRRRRELGPDRVEGGRQAEVVAVHGEGARRLDRAVVRTDRLADGERDARPLPVRDAVPPVLAEPVPVPAPGRHPGDRSARARAEQLPDPRLVPLRPRSDGRRQEARRQQREPAERSDPALEQLRRPGRPGTKSTRRNRRKPTGHEALRQLQQQGDDRRRGPELRPDEQRRARRRAARDERQGAAERRSRRSAGRRASAARQVTEPEHDADDERERDQDGERRLDGQLRPDVGDLVGVAEHGEQPVVDGGEQREQAVDGDREPGADDADRAGSRTPRPA